MKGIRRGSRDADIITGMRPTGVLLAAVLVVAGCGGNSPSTPAATKPADHGDTSDQSAVLTKALASFTTAGSGTYEAEVTADGVSQPLAHESGSFDTAPLSWQFERAILGIDQTSSQPRVQVVRVRATADNRSFVQVKEWGNWTGCWLPMKPDALQKQTGIDLHVKPALPTAIGVLARARVTSGNGLAGTHLGVDAYSALQFLGVAASAIAPQRAALSRISVPVLLDVTSDGDPSGIAVEGTQAAAALSGAGLALDTQLTNYVAKAHAEVVLSDLGAPVDVKPPSKPELLPARARLSSTCAANR